MNPNTPNPNSPPVTVTPPPSGAEHTTTVVTANPSITNPQTVTIETTKTGGLSIKLPTLALIHILSLAGICGGAYQVVKPAADATATIQNDIEAIKREINQSLIERTAMLERLAWIETNTENTRDAVRDLRWNYSSARRQAAASGNNNNP